MPPDINPDGKNFIDYGLGVTVNDPAQNGKFKVPTLRNVAVATPYTHNGLFKTLREVIHFYNKHIIAIIYFLIPSIENVLNKQMTLLATLEATLLNVILIGSFLL